MKGSPAVDGDVSGTREDPWSMKTSKTHRDRQAVCYYEKGYMVCLS